MAFAPAPKKAGDRESPAKAAAATPRGAAVAGLPLYVQAWTARRGVPSTFAAGSGADLGGAAVVGTAADGVAHADAPLPHHERIQAAFGAHDIGHVRAAVGGEGGATAERLGARAYTMGDRVAFREAPDVRLAAHEAAHVVQQRAGVQLAGGVGRAGDPYEHQADAVADAVVAGRSAEPLLGAPGASSVGGGVQMACGCGGTCGTCAPATQLGVQFSLGSGAVHVVEPMVHVEPSAATRIRSPRTDLAPKPAAPTPAGPPAPAAASGASASAPGEASDPAFDAAVAAAKEKQCPEIPDLPPEEKQAKDEDEDHEACKETIEDRTGDATHGLWLYDQPADKAPPSEPEAPEIKLHGAPPPEPEAGQIKVDGSNQGSSLPPKETSCGKQDEKPEESKCGEQPKEPVSPPAPDPEPPAPEGDPPVSRPDLGPAIGDAETGRDEAVAVLDGEQAAAAGPLTMLDELAAQSVRFAPGTDPTRGDAETTASTALAGNARMVKDAVTTTTAATTDRLAAALAGTQLDIARSAAGAKQAISARFAAARMAARREAAAARVNVELAYAGAAIKAILGTVATAGAIERHRGIAANVIDRLAESQHALIGRKVLEGQVALMRIGNDKAHRAVEIGNDYWSRYHKGRINREDGILDGHLTDRRAEARKQAARETSVAYRDQFVNAAANQAWQYGRAKPRFCGQAVEITLGAQTSVAKQAAALTGALAQMLPEILGDAADARTRLVGAIDDKLGRQLRTLGRTEHAQRQAVDDTAYLQQVTAERTAHAAAAQLVRGTVRVGQAMTDILVAARGRLEGSDVPPPALLRAALDQVGGAIAAGLARLATEHAIGVDAAEAALRDQAARAGDGLAELASHASEIADHLGEAFSAAMMQVTAGATRAFAALSSGWDKQLGKLLGTAVVGFTCAWIGVVQAFVKLNAAIDQGATTQQTKLGQSFDEQLGDRAPQAEPGDGCTPGQPAAKVKTLREDIEQYACEAAAKEEPAWKSALKWLLIIIVIVVVMIVLGPIVAELVGEGLLFLAAMGAITSVAVNGVNNLFAGRPFFQGALKAAVIGAISGLVSGGLGGGALGGGAAAIEGPLLTYLAKQLVVDMVTEYVSQVAGNVWDGRGWSSLWKIDLDGFKTAALMSGPMAMFGRGLHLRAKARAAGVEPHASTAPAEGAHVEAPAPHAEAPAPHAEGEAPHAKAPHAETPQVEAPQVEAPRAKAPHAEAPHAKVSHADAPAAAKAPPPHEVPTAPHEVPTAPHGAPAAPHQGPTAPHEAPTAPHEVPAAPHEAPAAPHQEGFSTARAGDHGPTAKGAPDGPERTGEKLTGDARKLQDELRHSVCGQCFPAGTKVLTPDGYVDIETIAIGDRVLSRHDDAHGAVVPRRVLNVFRNSTEQLVELSIRGVLLRTTPGHVIWTVENGWSFAGDAEIGHGVFLSDGTIAPIDDIRLIDVECDTYNLETDECHTYFVTTEVGTPGVWVHNTSTARILAPEQVHQLPLPEIIITDPKAIRMVLGKEIRAFGGHETPTGGLLQYLKKGGGAGFIGVTSDVMNQLGTVAANIKIKGGGVLVIVDLDLVQASTVWNLADPVTRTRMMTAYPRFKKMYERMVAEGVIAVRNRIPTEAVQGLVSVAGNLTDAETKAIVESLGKACGVK